MLPSVYKFSNILWLNSSFFILKAGRMLSDFKAQMITTEEELKYTIQVMDGPQSAMITGKTMMAK